MKSGSKVSTPSIEEEPEADPDTPLRTPTRNLTAELAATEEAVQDTQYRRAPQPIQNPQSPNQLNPNKSRCLRQDDRHSPSGVCPSPQLKPSTVS
mmetsp:Transcript_22858/g.56408  ORF Transcript_22858/g.56408 Transcript_22858/m.56408 type:complete len:95 (-) Transcript_22858:25-309(-)